MAFSPLLPAWIRATPTSPVSASGKLNRNVQWMALHARHCAMVVNCAAPSPARSGCSVPATITSRGPATRQSGKTSERDTVMISSGLGRAQFTLTPGLRPGSAKRLILAEGRPSGGGIDAIDPDPARGVHRRPGRRRGGRALVPDRRPDRRPPVLYPGHARLGGV